MQPFYFCDWSRGCLVSATADLIIGEVQVRKQSERQDEKKSTETQVVLPRACKLEDADESILSLLEEMSHNQGQCDEGSKM